jgi:hypothetical protein
MLLLVLLQSTADALSIASDTMLSKISNSEVITISDDRSKNMPNSSWKTWDISAGAENLQVTNPSSAATSWEKSNQFSFDLGWEFTRAWSLDLAVDTTTTPSESLKTTNGELEFGYKVFFGEQKKEAESTEYISSLKSSLKVGSGSFVQTSDALAAQGFPALQNALTEKFIGLWETYRPNAFWKLKLGGESFSYDKSPTAFIASLNKIDFYAPVFTGLANSLATLNQWDADATVAWYFSDPVDLEVYYKYGISAIDASQNTVIRATLTITTGEHSSIAPGVEQDYSAVQVNNMAQFNWTYNF